LIVGVIGTFFFIGIGSFYIFKDESEYQRRQDEQRKSEMRKLGLPENATHSVCTWEQADHWSYVFSKGPEGRFNFSDKLFLLVKCQQCNNDLMSEITNIIVGKHEGRCKYCGGRIIDLYWVPGKGAGTFQLAPKSTYFSQK
jgi:DNA-directed RNA polymerase subunit RPC12/RpoP